MSSSFAKAFLALSLSLFSFAIQGKILVKSPITGSEKFNLDEIDLAKIKRSSELSRHEGILKGINIRIKDENKNRIRVSLDRAKVEKDNDSFCGGGELRAFIATVDDDEKLQEDISKKSLQVGRVVNNIANVLDFNDAYLLDAVTLMRADVTRAIQQLDTDEDKPLPPTVSGDNLHVDGLDLSLRNVMPGDIIRINDVLLFATHNPHYACSKFQGRYGELAYDFINSEGEFFAFGHEYNHETFSNPKELANIENELNSSVPDYAQDRLGAFHRLRGIRLAVLRPGVIKLKDQVKVYRKNTIPTQGFLGFWYTDLTVYRFSGNPESDTIQLSNSELTFMNNRVV